MDNPNIIDITKEEFKNFPITSNGYILLEKTYDSNKKFTGYNIMTVENAKKMKESLIAQGTKFIEGTNVVDYRNISKTENTDTLFSDLVQNGIYIDVLINNVGVEFTGKSIEHLDLEEWHRTFNTNIFGPMSLTKLISVMMMDKNIHGSIIFITSIHQWTIRGIQSYSSSKAALGMIIKELALELAPYRIRVNGIAPGWVKVDEQGSPYPNKDTPLHNSSIDPCYIGRAAVYLASDYFSHFTTGTVLKIDAGLSLHNHTSLFL